MVEIDGREYVFVAELELFKCDISPKEVIEQYTRYDRNYHGYWIPRDSYTATLLALKGVHFGNKWITDDYHPFKS